MPLLVAAAVVFRCGGGGIDTDPRTARGAAAGLRAAGSASTVSLLGDPADGGLLGRLTSVPAAVAQGRGGAMRVTIQLYGQRPIEFTAPLVNDAFSNIPAGPFVCSGQLQPDGARGACVSSAGEMIPFRTRAATEESKVKSFCTAQGSETEPVWYVVFVDDQVLAGLFTPEEGAQVLSGQLRGNSFALTPASGASFQGVRQGDTVTLTRAGVSLRADSATCPSRLLPLSDIARGDAGEPDIRGESPVTPTPVAPTGDQVGDAGPPREVDAAARPPILDGPAEVSTGENVPDAPGSAALKLDLGSGDFRATVTESAPPLAFPITNSGSGRSGLIRAEVTGPDAVDFVVTGTTCGDGLAGGGSCIVNVGFRPRSAGNKAATLTIRADPGGVVSARLTGVAVGQPRLAASPTSLRFPAVRRDVSSPAQTVTLTNTGTASSGPVSLSVDPPFQIGGDGCSLLAPGAMCTVPVRVRPTSAGAFAGALRVSTASGASVTVPLEGTALEGPRLELAPPVPDLSDNHRRHQPRPVGHRAERGDSPTTGAVMAALQPLAAAEFAIPPGGCAAVLAAGSSCAVGVRFQPASAGDKRDTLTVRAGDVSASAALTGTATVAPAPMLLSPQSGMFPATAVGARSPVRTFTVTNPTGGAASPVVVTLSGPQAADFSIASSTCDGALAAGATCQVDASFGPTAVGSRAATLAVSLGALSDGVPLTGAGLVPPVLTQIAVTPVNPEIERGAAVMMIATLVFSDGTTRDGTQEVTWISTSSVVAVVSNAAGSRGRVTGVSMGMTTIFANLGGVSGLTMVRVLMPIPP